jgi:hypothetical protein
MRFVVDQLLRVHRPGTNVCIHIQQFLAYKVQHGFMGRRDFNGAMRDVFRAGGFQFIGEMVIQKNPQAMAQRQQLHSLMFVTGKRNANMLAPCPNDYVLIFQKPGECEHPVRAIYSDYAEQLTRAELAETQGGNLSDEDWEAYLEWYRHYREDRRIARTHNAGGWLGTEDWIRDAHGIWTDILEVDVLDGARSKHLKEDEREKHVCCLQLEVIRRCVQLYSNPVSIQPDVTVLDPFMGIGSTAWVCLGAPSPATKLALHAPRNVIGFELKGSYHREALGNVRQAR